MFGGICACFTPAALAGGLHIVPSITSLTIRVRVGACVHGRIFVGRVAEIARSLRRAGCAAARM